MNTQCMMGDTERPVDFHQVAIFSKFYSMKKDFPTVEGIALKNRRKSCSQGGNQIRGA